MREEYRIISDIEKVEDINFTDPRTYIDPNANLKGAIFTGNLNITTK